MSVSVSVRVRGLVFLWHGRQRGQQIIVFRCDIQTFSTSVSSVFCIFLLSDEQELHGIDE